MWGPLLLLALLVTINPIRLAIILVVLSRARPMQNLLAFWAGTGLVGVTYMIVPLIVLHYTPTFSFTDQFTELAARPTAQYTTIGIGLVLLSIAVLMVVRSVTRARSSSSKALSVPHSGPVTSTLTPDPPRIPLISRLTAPIDDAVPGTESRAQRLFRRAQDAWQHGSPWIAFFFGLMVMPADGILFALALIVTSGAAIGTQICAGIIFIIGHLAVEEIILVSNLVAPEKTQDAVRRLHDWTAAHHRKFMTAIFAVVGLTLIIRGTGII